MHATENFNLRTASLTDVKTQWHTVVKKTRRKPIAITYKGEPEAILMGIAEYRRIMQTLIEQAEDAEDLAAVAERAHEERIPFETVVADLKRRGRL